MMVKNPETTVCSECGARVKSNANVCDLCGNTLNEDQMLSESSLGDGDVDAMVSQPVEVESLQPKQQEGVFCNQCGWRSPSGARFCSQCGERLQDVATAQSNRSSSRHAVPVGAGLPGRSQTETSDRSEGAEDNQNAVTRQVVVLVTAGTLLVIALYLITVFSRTAATDTAAETGSTSATQELPTAPLPPQIAGEAAVLEDQIADLTGEEKTAKQQELVNLYLQSGRLDLAAQEQERLAETVNTTEAWSNAGHYYYGYMEQVEGQPRVAAGQKAIAAYQRVLEQEPGNNDVRTDMATAFLYTNNPMEGVNQIKQVLDSEPDHVQANFNYGVMLSMIGRVDQAISQFERVKTLVPQDSDNYRQANAAIETLRNSAGPAGSGATPAM